MKPTRSITWDESTMEQQLRAKGLVIICAKVFSVVASKDVTAALRKLVKGDLLRFDTGSINTFTCGDISPGYRKHLYFEYTTYNSPDPSSCAKPCASYGNVYSECLNKNVRCENDKHKHDKCEHDKCEHDKCEHDKCEHDKCEHGKCEHGKCEHGKCEHGKCEHKHHNAKKRLNKRLSRIEAAARRKGLFDESFCEQLINLRRDIKKPGHVDKCILNRIEKLQHIVDSVIESDAHVNNRPLKDEKTLQCSHKNNFYRTYFDKEFISYEPTKFIDDAFSVSFNFWFSKQCTIRPYFYFVNKHNINKTDLGAQTTQCNNYINITFGPFQKMTQKNRPTDVYIVIKTDKKIIFFKHHKIQNFNDYSYAATNLNNSINLNCMLISCASLPGYRSPAPKIPELYNKLTQIAKDRSADYIISTGDTVYLEPLNITSGVAVQAGYSQLREYERLAGIFSNHSWLVCNDDHEFSRNDGLTNAPLINILRNSLNANFPIISDVSREYRADVRINKDITFITLDDVSCRKANTTGVDNNLFLSILGESQLQFLLQSLSNVLTSYGKDALCFILVGKSMFGQQGQSTFLYCPNERQQILDGIISLGLRNVCFLCGDSHFSDVSEYNYISGNLIIREIRCSAIGSTPRTGDINNNRVENSLFTDNNFGSLNITGKINKYTISYSTHSTNTTATDGIVYTYSWKTDYVVPV